jgi:hypothetical protein
MLVAINHGVQDFVFHIMRMPFPIKWGRYALIITPGCAKDIESNLEKPIIFALIKLITLFRDEFFSKSTPLT